MKGENNMRLVKARVTNFRSIHDSTEFEIGDVTCLVGKNESGKTAILHALYRLNPVVESKGDFDVTDDYPRRSMSDYEDDVDTGRREPAQVVEATYQFDAEDITAVVDAYGSDCLKSKTPTLVLRRGYSNETSFTGLEIDEKVVIKHIIDRVGLSQHTADKLRSIDAVGSMVDVLTDAETEQTGAVQALTPTLQEISTHGVSRVIYDNIVRDRIPKFLYFDNYYQLKGQDNLNTFRDRVANNDLEDSDHPLVGLIDVAGLKLDHLSDPQRTQALLAKLQAAENKLTQKALAYWTQNRHLQMRFDIRPALPEDGVGMTSGMNIWGLVRDTKHMADTPLGTRSRGFVWFFSFLAWYSKLRKENSNLILLLDEPGLSLHAKAQADLLHYFEEELRPHHQLIYTTHSPFMVDPARFDRVRIVQDLSIETNANEDPEEQDGTRVITEVLEATEDSLFPLQGALGYEIHQTLFVGPNSLIVEGVSDLLYLQTMSGLLQKRGEPGLSEDWTITPVGGADKVPAFVALLGAQRTMNVAVLLDVQKKDRQKIENIFKKKLLQQKKVLTYADFVCADEADVEDLFDPEFYLLLVNGVFGSDLSHLKGKHPRILRRIEGHLAQQPLPDNAKFNHYRPAYYFSSKIDSLAERVDAETLDRFQRVFGKLNDLL